MHCAVRWVWMCLRRAIALLALVSAPTAAWADAAQVILLFGKAEFRASIDADWQTVAVGQQLATGSIVRTRESSQIGLLLRDQTQIRMNQSSTLQIRQLAESGQPSTLELLRGRIWFQVKQTMIGTLRNTTKLVNTQRDPVVRIHTPTVTIGIRGTDWETVVADDGTTTVTVVQGEVELSNPQGSLLVRDNEQAVAEAGKAPVKRLLSNARDRVQWVTAYRPEPRRWVSPVPQTLAAAVAAIEAGNYAAGASLLQVAPNGAAAALLLRADLALGLGQIEEALAVLQPLTTGQGLDPLAVALAGRAHLLAGRMPSARVLLVDGLARFPGHPEIALALADLARLDGDDVQALALFTSVSSALPDKHEAWFGIGRVQTEREHFDSARVALDEALRLAPNAPGYLGERAILEALGGSVDAARTAFDLALSRQPDDYLALTGLGILQLRTGQTDAALQSFLKAGLIEPRYARAQLYIGVAYYQLGNRRRALESVRQAAALDARDPLPYMMLGLMESDALQLRAAVDAAREAQLRMPYLKSLNQLQSNQKGSANIGSALAAQGMDEWAHAYAVDGYNRFWAGSALFLADRYNDGYNKSSELYRGFLLDPTVFGASNRFSSLVATPGHYGSISLRGERGDFSQDSLQLAANGLAATPVPFAYSLITDSASGHANPDTVQLRGNNLTVGLGIKPNPDTGVFYFGTRTDLDGHFSAMADPAVASLTDDRLQQHIARQDIGLHYRVGPANGLMVKLGGGRQSTQMSGALFHAGQAAALNTTFAAVPALLPFSAAGRLDTYATGITQRDMQLRHALDLRAGVGLEWGIELGQETRRLDFVRTLDSAAAPLFAARLRSDANVRMDSTAVHVSTRVKMSPAVDMQFDLVHQHTKARADLIESLDLIGVGNLLSVPTRERSSFSELNHRIGVAITPRDGHKLRLVVQRWRHPASSGSLGPVDTLGIPVDDRLVEIGGLLQRARLQYDWQLNEASFLQGFLDRRRATNLQSATSELFRVFGVQELDSLRARKPVFGEPLDELEQTPAFSEGVLSSAGVAANWLLTARTALAARYTRTHSTNTSAAFAGNRVPYIPRHFANLSLFLQAQDGWLLAVSASYRSARFTDEANRVGLDGGWIFGLTSYWETDDKRWSLEAGLNNLHANKGASVQRRARLDVNATYRF
jgi:Flp pilus assembly protein TadD